MNKLTSMWQIKNRVIACGSHFFDRDAMRFFRSRTSDKVYPLSDGSCIFITSEQFVAYQPVYQCAPRKYTIRKCDMEGWITELSEFQAYGTASTAHRHAAKLKASINQWDAREV